MLSGVVTLLCWPRAALRAGPSTEGSQSLCGSIPQVPRLLFEDWTHEDFRNVLDSEDEIEELGKTMVQVAKVSLGTAWGQHGLSYASS